MFVGSTHVGGVGGHSTKITEIIVWTISAPVATFATPRTYNSVRRLSSRICICHISRMSFRCLLCFSSTLALCRCFGGSIGVIVFQWILVVSAWIGNWGSLWWSSSLCCGCCRADPCGLSSVGFEGWLWALFSLSCLGPLRMVFSLLPSSYNDCCCGCVAMLSVLGGTNLPWMFLFVMDSSGLYEALPLGSWWASLRFAASL